MESLERKDASTGPEEPIKSEGIVPSPDTSERSNSAASPPPNCSICLGKLINTSFTDSCLHQFCFTCLLQWSKIKTECPLCKQTFKSIIHNVRSEEDYDQYHVQYTSQVAAALDVTADIHISGQWDVAVGVPTRPFMYRTTMGANRRYGMVLNPEAVSRGEQIPSIAPQVSHEERRRRLANPIDYRRTIYRHGFRAVSLPDAFGRFRESSAEYYRRNPLEICRLIPWLNREVQALIGDERLQHVSASIKAVITDSISQYDIHSVEFHNIVRPFFGNHTDHFIHELSNYARTNFDLVGYDQAVTYNRGLSNEYVPTVASPTPSTSSSSSSDSDVCILNNNFDSYRLNSSIIPSIDPHLIDMPGPSTVGQAFSVQMPYTVADVLTISSTSSSENECEVIGYVKPRHERTPEIIDLSSSEAETNNASQSTSNNTQAEPLLPLQEEVAPSTSSSGDNNNNSRRTRRRAEDIVRAQMYEYLDTSLESDSEETDSDYNPVNTKSRRHKNSKKVSKTVLRKLRSRKRKKSIGVQRKRDKEPRNRSYSSGSDNENPQRETSSRGKKRYLSKSSGDSESETITKKSKKSKKAKSSKKAKKRIAASTSKASYIYSSSYSSSSSSDCNSDSEEEKTRNNRRRTKKKSSSTNSYRYSSEEPSTNEKSSKSSSSTRRTSQRKVNRFPDSDLSDYRRSLSSRRSSSESFDSHKNLERLQVTEDGNSRHCTSDDDKNRSSYQRSSSSVFSDDASSYPKGKNSVKSTSVDQTSSLSSDRSNTATTSTSSSKSDMSSPAEHSVSSKSSRERHRSHKKRKESKKRRRSRS